MAITQYYVDPAIDADSGAGTIDDPWGDLQYALNTATRDTVNGDQFNIKSGTPEVLTAPLDLTAYGLWSDWQPGTRIRGYTATANDGGRATIDGNNGNFTLIAGTPKAFSFIDIRLTNFGTAEAIVLGTRGILRNCEIDTISAGGLNAVYLSGNNSALIGCYLHDITKARIVSGNSSYQAIGNYFSACVGENVFQSNVAIGNILLLNNTGSSGINVYNAVNGVVIGNIVYNAAAGTLYGIMGNALGQFIANNIVCGFSGVSGRAIQVNPRTVYRGYNAFWNNTENYLNETSDDHILGADVTLAADPFTDAANGDFSLTAAAKAALADKGWPSSYLGAHANTNPHITIGAIQQALATGGGGFPKIASVLGRTRM